MDLFLAIALSIGGVGMLYASWRRTRRRKGSLRPLPGWLLIALSVAFWVRFGGVDFGIAYAMIAVAVVAWSFTTIGREPTPPGQRRQVRIDGDVPTWAGTLRTLARILIALPLAGAASLLTSAVMVAGLPGGTTNRYVISILVAPVIWGALAFWVAMTPKLGRATILLVSLSAACSVMLFVG